MGEVLEKLAKTIEVEAQKLLRIIKRKRREIARKICYLMIGNELYEEALKYFGLKASVNLAILIARLDLSKGKHKIKKLSMTIQQ